MCPPAVTSLERCGQANIHATRGNREHKDTYVQVQHGEPLGFLLGAGVTWAAASQEDELHHPRASKDSGQLQAAPLSFLWSLIAATCVTLGRGLVIVTFWILQSSDLHEFPKPCKLQERLSSLKEGML